MNSKIDFKRLADHLISDSKNLLPQWLPGGKFIGKEYCCGDLAGTEGLSLKVSWQTGVWCDFATGEKGGDLIDLYASVNRVSNGEAAKELQKKYGGVDNKFVIPNGADIPASLKSAKEKWLYHTPDGRLVCGVVRWNNSERKKSFTPWSYREGGGWERRAWPDNRYLYNLHKLKDGPVLIVEGEKAADAAIKLAGDSFSVVTWQGGCNAIDKSDWSSIYDREILIWPDADTPGKMAAAKIANKLLGKCKVKILKVEGMPEGWDAADAVDEGWDNKKFLEWSEKACTEAISNRLTQAKLSGDPATSELWEKLGLSVAIKSGKPFCNIHNAFLCLEKIDELANSIWFDEFSNRILTNWQTDKVKEWSDKDDVGLTRFFQGKLGLDNIAPITVSKAVDLYSYQNKKNAPRDWMESLKWDGTQRVKHFFTRYFSVTSGQYSQIVSKNFLVGIVARIYRPGCKLDNMVVMHGSEDLNKSTALEALAGEDWFFDTSVNPNSKDFFLGTHGKMIIELAELSSLNKLDTNSEKSLLSTRIDRYRLPYEKRPSDFPRQFVFVGTTNDEEILRSTTGNRRFWPITVYDIDKKSIVADREQIFAEAVAMFKAGEKWWEMPKELIAQQHEGFREIDPWEDIIIGYLAFKNETTISHIIKSALKIDPDRQNKMHRNRIGGVLRSIGWKSKVKKQNGACIKVWSREPSREEVTN